MIGVTTIIVVINLTSLPGAAEAVTQGGAARHSAGRAGDKAEAHARGAVEVLVAVGNLRRIQRAWAPLGVAGWVDVAIPIDAPHPQRDEARRARAALVRQLQRAQPDRVARYHLYVGRVEHEIALG